MAINLEIYSNVSNQTKSINIDFASEIATLVGDDVLDENPRHYFKFRVQATDTDDIAYPMKVATDLTDLALNKTKRSMANDSNAYSDIKEMIIDYVYDFIHGHTADQFSSGCTYKAPMKFN